MTLVVGGSVIVSIGKRCLAIFSLIIGANGQDIKRTTALGGIAYKEVKLHMKNCLYLLLSSIISFSLLSCSDSKKAEKNDNCKLIHVNPDHEDIVSSQAIFSNIQIIPLEGRVAEANISSFKYKLVVTDDVYYVLDQRSCRIICFSSKGKWLQTSDKKGRGVGEFLMSSDFRFDEADSTLVVVDPRGIVNRYSLEDGLPFISQSILDGNLHGIHSLLPISSGEYLTFSESDEHHLFTINTNNKECKPFLYNYPHWLFGTPYAFAWTPFLCDNKTIYYYEGLNGNLYIVNLKDLSIDKVLSWDFGEHQFDAKKLETDKDVDYYVKFWSNNSNKWVTPIHIEFVSDQIILARIYYDNSWKNIVFNRKTNEYKCFSRFIEGGSYDILMQYKGKGYLLIPPNNLRQIVNEEMITDPSSIMAMNSIQDTDNYVLVIYSINE